MAQVIADRMAVKGDAVTGLYAQDRKGMPAWSGEFHAEVGQGKVASFAAGCNRDEIAWIYLFLTDGTVALVDLGDAVRRGL